MGDRLGFRGPLAWASNFSPCRIVYRGIPYPSVEHAFQASKTTNRRLRRVIANAALAADAKALGKRVPLRKGWSEMRVQVMYDLLCLKFSQPEYRDLLLSTGQQELVEWNSWHDTFWGVDRATGEGENLLGHLLMRVRSELQQESE